MERTGEGSGRVAAVLSAAGRGASTGALPAGLVAELMAQAALLLSGTGRSGVLAGLSGVVIERPPGPGDALTVHVAVAGRMGPVVKFEAALFGADGVRVAGGSFVIRLGRSATEMPT